MDPKPGDIILYPVTPRSELTSRLVAAGQMLLGAGRGLEQYSHAAIFDKPGFQFEAKWPKTGCFQIDDSRMFEIWNVGNPTDEQRRQILNWARHHCGEWYNMIGLLSFGVLGIPGHVVCSQFVDMAYRSAHIVMDREGERLLSPDAIADAHGARMLRRYAPASRRVL